MSTFDKNNATTADDRINEEQLYSQVVSELKAGIKREALWIKAFSKSEGDKSKAQALYIEYLIQSLKDEVKSKGYKEHDPQEHNTSKPTTKFSIGDVGRISFSDVFIITALTFIFGVGFFVLFNSSNSIPETDPEIQIIDYSDGTHYEGEMQGEKRHGQGVLLWSNGDRYAGSFVDDEMSGYGVLIWSNGNCYEGIG